MLSSYIQKTELLVSYKGKLCLATGID